MSKTHAAFWKWLLTVYILYLLIYIFLQIANGFPSAFFWIPIIAGNLFAIFSIYRFIEMHRGGLRKLLRLIIFAIYILYTIFNTLVFSVLMSIDFWSYFSATTEVAAFVLDITGLIFPIIALYPVTKVFTKTQLDWKNLLRYLWTGYLWGMWFMLLLAFGSTLLEIQKWTLYDYLSWTSIIFVLVGLFSYHFKRAIFTIRFWRVYFCISIVWAIAECVYYFGGLKEYFVLPDYLKSHTPETESPLVFYLIFLILYFPIYIPLYKISFGRNFSKKK